MDPITLTAAATAVRTLSANSDLVLTAATWLYHVITDTKPIIDIPNDPNYQDKTHYSALCLARKKLTGADYIPKQWELDPTDKPTNKVLFLDNVAILKQNLSELRECNYHQKNIAIGLLANIQSIFEYMNEKRPFAANIWSYLEYREDGYEAMFFADLAIWIGIILPRYDVKDPKSAELVSKIIDYCKYVQKEILVPRNDDDNPNNPKVKLGIIIKELEQLNKNLQRANKESSFNEKIQRINSHILEMTQNVFNLFNLIIKDSPHDVLQLRELLREAGKHPYLTDPKTKKQTETLMGRWIVESLQKLGIESFDYANTTRVDIQSIERYAIHDFSGLRNLDSTGLFSFACHPKEKGLEHLKNIIELHHLLLKLYAVRESVVLGAMVSRDLGDSWVYGEDTGLALVEALLLVIDDAAKKLNQGVLTFWSNYYDRDFKTFSDNPTNSMNGKNPYYTRVITAEKTVDKISKTYLDIKEVLKEIQTEASKRDPNEEGKIFDKIELLRRNLGYYVKIEKLEMSSRLENELLFSDSPRSVETPVQYITRYSTVGDKLEIEHLFGYSKQVLPFYNKAELIIYPKQETTDDTLGKVPGSKADESPVEDPTANYEWCFKKPSTFHSVFQRKIYDEVLYKNSGLFVKGDWFRTWRYHNPDKFGEMYIKIHKIFHKIYFSTKTLTDAEIILIDCLMHDYIVKQFAKYNFYSLDLPYDKPFLTFVPKEDLVYVELTEKYKGLAEGVVANCMKHEHHELIAELNQKAIRVEELERENKAFLDTIAKQELDIQTKENEKLLIISERDTAISELGIVKDELINKDLLITNLIDAISELQGQARDLKRLEASTPACLPASHDGDENEHAARPLKSSGLMDTFFSKKVSGENHALLGKVRSYTSK